ncbi:DUF2953 domain-containing protein [Methanoplanus limicola]|uniref:DUF2953 domain-containing protein n=1 Tax=Methanoplanus limicola DSM 2279 TaxID=937775 RepID=H1YZA0_9EURY|nr:DUF2953 domain-containing protein [Methanoplanus limicola]EHQ35124.1 hypothetical protein Metlim_1002 [Methanoplanus limicola DSM 2279]
MILQIIFLFLLLVLLTAVLHIFIFPVHIGLKGGYPFKCGVVFEFRWGIASVSGDVKDGFLTVRLYGFKVFRKPVDELNKNNSGDEEQKDSKSVESEDLTVGDKKDLLKIICFAKDNFLTEEFSSLLRLIKFDSLHTDITVGLDDPVLTGKVYGYLMAVSGFLYSCRGLSLNAYSRFDRPAFEVYCDGRVRVCGIYRILFFALKTYRRLRGAGLAGKKTDAKDKSSGTKDGISEGRGAESSLKGMNNPV